MSSLKQEYQDCLNIEVFGGREISFLKRLQYKHITPNTSFVYLCRTMWYHYKLGGVFHRLFSKLLYLHIYKRFSCCVFEDAQVGKGLKVYHPLGIVIGHCVIGENCSILQNVTIGEKNIGENTPDNDCRPRIGNNVMLSAGACVFGKVTIANNATIAANSVVNKDIDTAGVWGGLPVKLLKTLK